MNCRRFKKLLFEYAEGSLSAATHAEADRHSANCSRCGQVMRKHREFGRSLSGSLHSETEPIGFGPEEQRRLMQAIERQSTNAVGSDFMLEWWRRLAWIGTSAAVLFIALFLVIDFPFRSPQPGSLGDGSFKTPIVMRFSYCEPAYTFRREADLVVDSISCSPRVIDQTLWAAQNQKVLKPPAKSAL